MVLGAVAIFVNVVSKNEEGSFPWPGSFE